MNLRIPILAATILGLAAALWIIGSVGLADIASSAARLGMSGFLLVLLCTAGVLALLGAAWLAAMPGESPSRLALFIWARTAREGASDLLPFSQLGGLVVGARTLIGRGMAPPRVYASMIADLTTEMFAQLLFTLFGLWALGLVLIDPGAAHRLRPLVWAGAGGAVALTLAFVLLQRPVLRFAALLARRMVPDAEAGAEAIIAELGRFYRARGALSLAFLFNMLAWLASAALAWLILHLMGEGASLWQIVALESLIFAIRSAAFFVPGAIGLQEAGYLLLAPAFGVDPGAIVALSLIKRARDVAIGLPAILVWQAIELRAARVATDHERHPSRT